MSLGILLYLSSGLFLGWSLGANDAANVFGTAVGSRMLRFRSAALICAVFVAVGATVSGAGAAHTLGRLGEVNALAGSFTVALAAALTTFWMTRIGMPVSTSQSIVGAIIGWNVYTATVTDTDALTKIVLTWIACPLLAGALAILLFVFLRWLIGRTKPHLLRLDAGTRAGLALVGAFGSYSLGANNIANVMGVFLPDNPFHDVTYAGLTFGATQQLFLLGALAIGVGVVTYSQKVMRTVGSELFVLSPVSALVVVLAQALTLFLFASEGLQAWLASRGLPTWPLVPVSSSQAVVGAILGIGLLKGGRGLRFNVLGGISVGWVATPVAAGVVSLLLLFVMDNVFALQVSRPVEYRVDAEVVAEARAQGMEEPRGPLSEAVGLTDGNAQRFKRDLAEATGWEDDTLNKVLDLARVERIQIDPGLIAEIVDRQWLTPGQMAALRSLGGRSYDHAWAFHRDLGRASAEWRALPDEPRNMVANKDLRRKKAYLDRIFATPADETAD